MAFAKVYSAQPGLLDAHVIDVEVDISKGLHAYSVVGLPDKAVEESRDRVSSAIKNSGFKGPKQKNEKTVISLAPADLKKEGPLFDLAIALAYLIAAGDIAFTSEKKLFLGELALDGAVRPVRGVLPLALHARACGFTSVFVPRGNAREAALASGIDVFPVDTLEGIIAHLTGKSWGSVLPEPQTVIEYTEPAYVVDLADVRGQETAKRGLEIAAAGGHNLAMHGPPGTGKTMLARAFTGLLPPLTYEDILEVTSIHSVAGSLDELVTHPPLRSPHHTASYVALVGGGTIPKPGEVTLAHRGVLFLDEFPEFDRRVIEALRQPLEDRVVSVSRAKGSVVFPARAILIVAMNPCPCGNYGSDAYTVGGGKPCVCTPTSRERYRRKLSGPIVDRFDIWVTVGPVEHGKLSGSASRGEPSYAIRERVLAARALQTARFKSEQGVAVNADMNVKLLEKYVTLSSDVEETLIIAAKRLGLSARAYHRVIKLARTIADLERNDDVLVPHILEALQYRPKIND